MRGSVHPEPAAFVCAGKSVIINLTVLDAARLHVICLEAARSFREFLDDTSLNANDRRDAQGMGNLAEQIYQGIEAVLPTTAQQ